METKRFYLDEGGGFNLLKKRPYADFFLELRHGTQRTVAAIVRPYANIPAGDNPAKLSVSEDGTANYTGGRTVEIELNKVDWTAVDDVIILGQVEQWSFGPVDQATLDSLPDDVVKKLVAISNQLYGGTNSPLPGGGGGN